MYVIGTAGHVDHGKSTLVHALTGIDPDRLKEEKARQMTIDLGFAWFTLPNGELIGVVDVPGHRDFIENMLAGVGGINAVLFVIAADEGVMPQTREHLAIVDLLKIPTGIIVLTKTDLVADPEWLDLVQIDILDTVRGTTLENAPILPVSAKTGQGLSELQSALMAQLVNTPAPVDRGKPRLWVDRVFSVSGFGTVVTGTLLDGMLHVGQEIQFQPTGLCGRIRGLQTHNKSIEIAQPGSRVAVNVSGIERTDVQRGYLLALPEMITPSHRIAAYCQLLPNASRPLRHNADVKVFCGSAETMARVRLLETDSLIPGQSGWIQLEMVKPLPLIKGERFILRYPSPAETIGGGQVVQTGSMPRYRRNQSNVIPNLNALLQGTPEDLILHALNSAVLPLSLEQLAEVTHLSSTQVKALLNNLYAANSVLPLHDLWLTQSALDKLLNRLTDNLVAFHHNEPLRIGIRIESLRHQMKLDSDALNALLSIADQRKLIQRTNAGTIAQYGYTPQPTKSQRTAIDRLMAAFGEAPYMPPSVKEAEAVVGDDVLSALIEWGELVKVSEEVLLTPQILSEYAIETRQILATEGAITIKMLRDKFNTSRKYTQAVLEYFDAFGITRRKDDAHVLATGNWQRVIAS